MASCSLYGVLQKFREISLEFIEYLHFMFVSPLCKSLIIVNHLGVVAAPNKSVMVKTQRHASLNKSSGSSCISSFFSSLVALNFPSLSTPCFLA